jgi:hypothetical protein
MPKESARRGGVNQVADGRVSALGVVCGTDLWAAQKVLHSRSRWRERPSDQTLQNVDGNLRAKHRSGFEKPRDIGEVLLTLAGAAGHILERPDLAL